MSRRTGDVRDTRSRGFERGFADAILGSRPATDLILPAEVPSNADNNAPLFEDLRKFANRSFAAYPGQPMRVSFTPGDISADYTWSTQDNSIDGAPRVREAPLGPENSPTTLEPGVGYSYGRSQGGVVTVAYDDACAGRQTRTIKSGKFEGAPQIDPITRQTYVTLPLGQNVRTGGRGRTPAGGHDDYSSNHVDGFHWTESNGIGPMGCHGFHAHYNATNTDQVHTLEYETLPEEILTFVLPSAVDHGAGGAWGQPVLPVFLARKFDGKANPWALHFTLVGSEVEMHRSQVVAASAAGVAHYHRREHLGEPPNLLNPFWRATLQPMEIDHRDRGDPTKFSQGTRPMARTLTNGMRVYPQSGDALTAYRGLFDKVHGMELAPGDDGVVR
ncbi:MAG: hypothetical protein IPJ65_27795 [Archangiaceae bacterium]|nr:hypothetical protein [Archangiaceae bacterium]